MSNGSSGKSPQNASQNLLLPAELPGRCFISHSYQDGAVVESLIKMLQDHVEPVVFPRQEPDPQRAVSNEIIVKILDCPGLIYLKGGASEKSFWVSFERDYALRSKRVVYAYDPKRRRLTCDTSSPLPLDIAVVSHRSDRERVERLLSWMANERHFVIDRRHLRSTFGGFTGDIMLIMEELLMYGGVILWMMGRGSQAIADSFYSEDFLDYVREYSALDYEFDEDTDPYGNVHSVFARIDPEWEPPRVDAELAEFVPASYNALDLYEGLSDTTSFNWNRVDDLIIRLYAQVLVASKSVDD